MNSENSMISSCWKEENRCISWNVWHIILALNRSDGRTIGDQSVKNVAKIEIMMVGKGGRLKMYLGILKGVGVMQKYDK